jgi:glycosyltransferase involved in cell wall biosynthesis
MSARLCFVGPMIGRNPGQVTTQAEVQADLFGSSGWTVRETSRAPSRWIRLLDMVWCLVRWRRSIDIVVLSVFSGPAFLVADVTILVARWLRLPVVAVLHGGSLPDFERRHPHWVRRVLARTQAVVAPSSYLASQVMASADRVQIIPNVLGLGDYVFRLRSAPQPRLLWMRTFHPLYNPEMAVQVLSQVRVATPGAVLTMAGQDKGCLDAIQAEAQRRSLADAITFPGFLDAPAKRDALDAHDIFLHTNHVDNAPVSVLEAAASGLPIVATSVGGIPWLLENERSALLVPDGDAAAMVQAVKRLLTEPGLAERLSMGGRQVAEASSWPVVLDAWEDVFESVLRPTSSTNGSEVA